MSLGDSSDRYLQECRLAVAQLSFTNSDKIAVAYAHEDQFGLNYGKARSFCEQNNGYTVLDTEGGRELTKLFNAAREDGVRVNPVDKRVIWDSASFRWSAEHQGPAVVFTSGADLKLSTWGRVEVSNLLENRDVPDINYLDRTTLNAIGDAEIANSYIGFVCRGRPDRALMMQRAAFIRYEVAYAAHEKTIQNNNFYDAREVNSRRLAERETVLSVCTRYPEEDNSTLSLSVYADKAVVERVEKNERQLKIEEGRIEQPVRGSIKSPDGNRLKYRTTSAWSDEKNFRGKGLGHSKWSGSGRDS